MTNVPSADGPPHASALSPALIALAEARQASQHEARRSLGIGEMDARALAFLAQNPGSRPSALRAHLGLTSAGVSTLCDRLIERGTIHRDTDPSDRRASLLTVTVDLSSSPWNRLNAFDRSLEAALAAEADPATLQRIAALLTHALSVTTQSPEGAESTQTG
ncbi:MarR family winged helix-turn-helix transcriptional regulator [Pseudoclavibacter sp. RFBA6]|uniref:MarR family winged helix-turn-helix transcriptional regulator n=1 Tax=Pseudoclavibacter sp. RFBA6 TaxID=2080573 RepID=UPI0015E1D710|nr:helix-turn-helix domain-containing protein [Pseudoclavibacter sp. RFBA6]